MAVKKSRKTVEFKRRSAASKKGWITRKKRELPKKIRRNETIIANAKKVLKQKNKRKPVKVDNQSYKQLQNKYTASKKRVSSAKKTVKQKVTKLKNKITKLQSKLSSKWKSGINKSDIALMREIESWEDTLDVSYLRYNGVIAMQQSRLRGRENAEELFNKMADALEEDKLETTARKIARAENVEVREVYTLFFSP